MDVEYDAWTTAIDKYHIFETRIQCRSEYLVIRLVRSCDCCWQVMLGIKDIAPPSTLGPELMILTLSRCREMVNQPNAVCCVRVIAIVHITTLVIK